MLQLAKLRILRLLYFIHCYVSYFFNRRKLTITISDVSPSLGNHLHVTFHSFLTINGIVDTENHLKIVPNGMVSQLAAAAEIAESIVKKQRIFRIPVFIKIDKRTHPLMMKLNKLRKI